MIDNMVEDTNRVKNDYGHMLIDNCVLTAESVDQYLGSELADFKGRELDRIYNVLRPISEIRKAIDTYKSVPVVNDHFFVGDKTPNRDKWLGTTNSEPFIKDNRPCERYIKW